MLIGIDLIGVQSPGGDSRESGRLGRQFVSALLAGDSSHRYVLYTHDGLPVDRVPSGRNALRVSLAGASEGPAKFRPAIQRVLDHNPDGLDWLILLDPFDPGYGGLPPESPLNGVKVASLITDLAPNRVDDRRLAPLRSHDAILAFSGSTFEECRLRLPSATRRIKRLGLAVDESWIDSGASGPLCESSAGELGRLGIVGPFLFANLTAGADRSNLDGVLEAYHRLPIEQQLGHQLVVAGEVADPWAAVAYLHEHGCAEGLVLVGSVDEPTLRTLYSRCSTFVSPSFREASDLSLVEAMSCGAPIVAGRAGSQAGVLAEAGLLADPNDPSEIAGRVASLLSDVDLARDLGRKARERSARFSWGPVIEEFLGVLRGVEPSSPTRRHRFDRSHVARRRIALFAGSSKGRSGCGDLDDRIARACLGHYEVDLYFEPGDIVPADRLPVEFGGFDARQFARNDDILDYHAVVYLLADVFSMKSNLGRLEARPGLVILRDETSLDRIEVEVPAMGSVMTDVEAVVACQRLRDLFLTSSRLGVRSSRNLEAIRSTFPGFAEQVVGLPPVGEGDGSSLYPRSVNASQPMADLIEGCAADLTRAPGQVRDRLRGRGLGSPTASFWPIAASDADDSYLEAR